MDYYFIPETHHGLSKTLALCSWCSFSLLSFFSGSGFEDELECFLLCDTGKVKLTFLSLHFWNLAYSAPNIQMNQIKWSFFWMPLTSACNQSLTLYLNMIFKMYCGVGKLWAKLKTLQKRGLEESTNNDFIFTHRE